MRRRESARWKTWRTPWSLGLLLATLASCSSTTAGTLYYHPNADLATYDRVAVLPFESLAIDRAAGERARDVVVLELAAQGLFDVVDVGEVNRTMRVQGMLDVSGLGPEEIKQLGEPLGVQALVLGTVIEYRERRSGSISAPEVSLSLRMLDVETGIAVWSVSDARTGASLTTRLFGVGERSLSQATRDLVRRMLDTLTY
jgi:curli biogenesis system outer membrane secretion channel CsgG